MNTLNTSHYALNPNSYNNHLKIINGVNFTPREVDIIACLLSGKGAKTIARFLSIEEKTVETHKYNVMRKLECNFKEGIIEFIEKSDRFSDLKDHYLCLLIASNFVKNLDQICNLSRNEGISCTLIYEKSDGNAYFIRQLEKHLKLAGIKVCERLKESQKPLTHYIDSHGIDSVIYLVSESFIEELQIEESKLKLEATEFMQKLNQYKKKLIFLLKNAAPLTDILQGIECIVCEMQEDYYFAVFKILQTLLPDIDIEKIALEFKKSHKTIDPIDCLPVDQNSNINEEPSCRELKEHTNKLPSSHIITQKNVTIRSDLVIPTESTLLNRDALISQIESALKDKEGIQTLALIGIGGAGKTTIARLFARSQEWPIVWEINAETQENLICCFENLAYALSQTEDEKRTLRALQEITNQKDKEDKVILFVKDKLKSQGNWFLIYDNVEKFSDIQKYFPFSVETWGKGKIIITSRDSNIQYNNHIKSAISVAELDINDSIKLFNNIMSYEKTTHFEGSQAEHIASFLNHIPPFPLDVSIAAYYLKSTNIPYKNYVSHLKSYNKDLDNMQQDIIKEATQYARTRYSIITLSLDCLLKVNKDFEDLLLLISLTDSQNIPKDMLGFCKNEFIVDSFIHNLRKYSLTICNPADDFLSTPHLTVHRSTQEISLAYLTKRLKLEEDRSSLNLITQALEKYTIKTFDDCSIVMIKNLKSHCEVFLSHANLLTKYIRASIEGILGGIHFNLGNYMSAKSFLEESLQKLNENEIENRARRAMVLVYLGMVCRKLGAYEKAKDTIEQGLVIYEKDFPDKHLEFSWALGHLGTVYRNLGNYEKAKTLFEESLVIYRKYFDKCYIGTAWALAHLGNMYRNMGNYDKAQDLLRQSLTIYKQNLPENHIEIAWVLTYLGNTYRSLGKYKEAEKLLKQSLKMYEEEFGKDHVDVAWVLTYLGKIYADLGCYGKSMDLLQQGLHVHTSLQIVNPTRRAWYAALLGSAYKEGAYFEKAKELLEESLVTYEKYFGKNHIFTAWIILYLGEFYKDSGNYEKTEELLKQSLEVYEDKFGSDHIKTARVLRDLGEVYFLFGYLEDAERYIDRALMILRKNKHPITYYKALESMAEISLEKSKREGNRKQAQDYIRQATDYQRQALTIVKTHFPADSPHILRIQAKLSKLEKGWEPS